jgi:septal ring factor EnvC (AmiA/AmiB activator)
MLVYKRGNDKVSESLWQKQGATLSHKNACKQFGLTEDEVFDAMKVGKLQYRQNYAHGNPYFRLLRNEVESLARELHGTKGTREQEVKHKLSEINKAINSLKRKLASLEKQRIELMKCRE